MKSSDARDPIAQRVCGKFTYANVTSTLAVLIALMGGAYANHLLVLSSDIVDGEVKTVDLGSNAVTGAKLASGAVTSGKLVNSAVTNAKLAATAVTGAKTVDNSLTGADIDESTLQGVDASELSGLERQALIALGGTHNSAVLTLPTCDAPLAYVTKSITVPWPGTVVVNGSFTAARGGTWPASTGIAARIEQTAPSAQIGEWQEDHVPTTSGRANVAVTQLFGVNQGTNTFILRVCANNTVQTIRGQLTFVYSANGTI